MIQNLYGLIGFPLGHSFSKGFFTEKFKKLGFTIALGRLHVSALPREAEKFADCVIQGEGEIIWETLLKDYEKKELKPFYSSLTNHNYTFHLNNSRIPKYELLDISKYNRLTIQTTRGCP